MNQITVAAFVGLVAVALAVGCGDDDDDPTATPPVSTVTATASPSPGAETTATPTPDVPVTHPPGTTSGVGVVDVIVAEILANDVDAVRSRLIFTPRPCTADFPGPECPPGVTEGTAIPAFRYSGCSANYEPDREDWVGPFPEGSAADELALYAVYEVDADALVAEDPAGAYGIVFAGSFHGITPDGPRIVDVRIDGAGGIVGWWTSCGGIEPDAALDGLPIGEFVLPPVAPADLPPPPYNRWIRPDTGMFYAHLWDDRPISQEAKDANPWYNPRWKPFSDCMVAEGFDVRPDPEKPFSQADLDELLRRANAELPDTEANKRIGSNIDDVPGFAGAFLRCGYWLALQGDQLEAHGIQRLEPGEVPEP